MKVIQEVSVDGQDLVVTLKDTAGKVLAERRWGGAARYVYATKEFSDKGHVFVLAVPVKAGLDIKGAEDFVERAL